MHLISVLFSTLAISLAATNDKQDRNLEFQRLYGVSYLSYLHDEQGLPASYCESALANQKRYDSLRAEFIEEYGGLEAAQSKVWKEIRSIPHLTSDLGRIEGWIVYGDAIDARAVADLEIKWVNDRIGFGVFARQQLKKGDLIGEYTGVYRLSPRMAGNRYLMATLDSPYIDAKEGGNETRFINHSLRSANTIYIYVFHRSRWHVLVVADRNIDIGEQIFSNYGDSYWEDLGSPENL